MNEQNELFKYKQLVDLVANSEIPVNENSGIYKLFKYRKELCIFIVNCKNSTDDEKENQRVAFEYCNDNIKKYLGL